MYCSSISENLALFTCRAKYVPDENGGYRLSKVSRCSRPIFNPQQLELHKQFDDVFVSLPEDYEDFNCDVNTPIDLTRSVRRAKQACFDYILCNKFDYFCTFTYNQNLADRTSYEDTYYKIATWFSNRVQRKGLIYLAVPEYHKDGQAIHFHALCNSSIKDDLVDSGHTHKRRKVYNISSWTWGFSTAIKISGESAQDKTAKYILKYMGKQQGQKIGGRYYLSGGVLECPRYVYSNDINDLCCPDEALYYRDCKNDYNTYEEWSFI